MVPPHEEPPAMAVVPMHTEWAGCLKDVKLFKEPELPFHHNLRFIQEKKPERSHIQFFLCIIFGSNLYLSQNIHILSHVHQLKKYILSPTFNQNRATQMLQNPTGNKTWPVAVSPAFCSCLSSTQPQMLLPPLIS